MQTGIWTGAALILLAGALQGTFAMPMKFAHMWKHENIWLIFAFTGLVLFPWLLTAATEPSLSEVYRLTSAGALAAMIGSGLCWGIGATLTGIGLRMVGISLGLGIILGLSASVGSFIPFIILTPGQLFAPRGLAYLTGTSVMLAGIALVAVAGAARERASGPGESSGKPRFLAGLLVCVTSGIFSSMLNFSFAFGSETIRHARDLGASSAWAANVVSAPATTGGFLANLIYCVYELRRNRSARLYFLPGTGTYWLFGTLMGAFWYGGLAIYGVGIRSMASFGTILGWPLLMGTIIIASNLAGFLTGEWTKAGNRARLFLVAGNGIVLAALIILARAQ